MEGNLETSHLLEQVRDCPDWRIVVVVLTNLSSSRSMHFVGLSDSSAPENSFLKGQDLLKEIETLPELPAPIPRSPTPPLVPSTLSDSDSDSEDEPRSPPTLRSLAVESKLLYREVIKHTSSPRLVDLSVLKATRANG